MNTILELFDLVGGAAEFGRIIGKRTEHASAIKNRGSIPVRYWPALIDAAKERGVPLTYEALVAIHAKKGSGEEAA